MRGLAAPRLAIAALMVMSCQPDQDGGDGARSGAAWPPAGDAGPDPFAAAIAENLPGVPDPAIEPGAAGETLADLDNAAFRDRAVAFVREVAAGGPTVACTLPLTASQPLSVTVWMFHGGAAVGRGTSADIALCVALKEATRRAVAASGPEFGRVAEARFVVELTDRDYALVEYEGRGVELDDALVPTRVLDREMLRRGIDEGEAYLLRVIDPALGGVHKYYHAGTDTFERRLHTIYTASTVFTLLALHAHDADESLLAPIERGAQFLLSMQSVGPGLPSRGAFHYALDLVQQEREPRFVVGTTSKSIFTLIELHALTGEPGYLDAARLAADWLLTMQRPDGGVRPELRWRPKGGWKLTETESLLYTGQVLSALSRLYAATGGETYLDGAARTAGYLAAKVARDGCYLGDDYRPPNPISSSWVILSLFDFARASGDANIKDTTLQCADELLARQIRDPDDVHRHGRWPASLSSSGAGWLAEVMSVLYLDRREDDPDRAARLYEAIVLLLRLLQQYTYSPENSFAIKDPERARGGLFWSRHDSYVRTDSVCHGMNAYVAMIDHLPGGVLVELPEPPLAERLGLEGRSGRLVGREDEEFDGASEEDDEPVAEMFE